MSTPTPSDGSVRGRYCDGVYLQTGHTTEGEDFDRWLAQHDAIIEFRVLQKTRLEMRPEASAEAERRWPTGSTQGSRWDGITIDGERALLMQRNAFVAGFLWSRTMGEEGTYRTTKQHDAEVAAKALRDFDEMVMLPLWASLRIREEADKLEGK